MIYEIKTKEYFKIFKRDIDVKWSIKTNSLEDAVNELYKHLKHYKWSKEKVRQTLLMNHYN